MNIKYIHEQGKKRFMWAVCQLNHTGTCLLSRMTVLFSLGDNIMYNLFLCVNTAMAFNGRRHSESMVGGGIQRTAAFRVYRSREHSADGDFRCIVGGNIHVYRWREHLAEGDIQAYRRREHSADGAFRCIVGGSIQRTGSFRCIVGGSIQAYRRREHSADGGIQAYRRREHSADGDFMGYRRRDPSANGGIQ